MDKTENMKVLQLINSLFIGGAEKLIVESVPVYQDKGIDMDVLCLKNTPTEFWKELENKTDTRIFGLTAGSVYNPFLVFKIIPFLKKYDIIHAHLFPTLYWVVLAKWLSFSKTKIIYTEHSTNNNRRKRSLFRILDKIIYSGLDRIVAIADEVETNIKLHLGEANYDFEKIYNGVDVGFYASAQPYPKDDFFSDTDFILIQVSSFREEKNQITLIESLQYLPENVKLLLVGEGPLKQKCIDWGHSKGLQDRIKFLGIRTDVAKLLKTSDVVVLSSHHEGLSLSSIEGMASGNPFIASNVPGLREIVKDYGLLFPDDNAEELAELIQKLIEDKNYYFQIAEKCKERAMQYDIASMVEKYIQLYKDV